MEVYRFVGIMLAASLALVAAGCRNVDIPADLTADELRDVGLAKMDAGNEPAAREYFERMITRSSSAAAEAMYYIALTYYRQELYEEAYVRFDQLIDRYPASEWCDDAQYMKGKVKLASVPPLDKDQTAVDEALDDFATLIEEYENSDLIGEAQEGIAAARRLKAAKLLATAKFYKKTGERRAAVVYFEYLAADYPEYEKSDEALFLAGECYGELGEAEASSRAYRNLLTRFPESRFAAGAAARLAALNG